MSTRTSIDRALLPTDHLPARNACGRHPGSSAWRRRTRILGAAGMASAVAWFAVVLWLNSADWRRLLLFAAIVCVAAIFGQRRQVSPAASRPVEGSRAASIASNASMGARVVGQTIRSR